MRKMPRSKQEGKAEIHFHHNHPPPPTQCHAIRRKPPNSELLLEKQMIWTAHLAPNFEDSYLAGVTQHLSVDL